MTADRLPIWVRLLLFALVVVIAAAYTWVHSWMEGAL